MIGNRTLKAGYIMYPGYAEACAFENVYNCKRPGISVETLLSLANFFSANLTMYRFKEYGAGDDSETDSVFKALRNGTIHAVGPDLWYMSDRLKYVPKVTFPLGNSFNCFRKQNHGRLKNS